MNNNLKEEKKVQGSEVHGLKVQRRVLSAAKCSEPGTLNPERSCPPKLLAKGGGNAEPYNE